MLVAPKNPNFWIGDYISSSKIPLALTLALTLTLNKFLSLSLSLSLLPELWFDIVRNIGQC